MAKSVNKVILLGNIGKDPEIKVLPSGQPVANFSIATSDRYKDQQGNFQDRTEWHNITAYGKLAEIVRDYVKKGSKLYVEGRLTTRSWDDKDSGKKVYRTEIVIADLSLLSGRGEDGGGGSSSGGYAQNRTNNSSNTASFDQRSSGSDDYANTGITDDDIPF
jgi:single-strand DNA-binding protein